MTTKFRIGKQRELLGDGKKFFEWPIEKREEGGFWHEVGFYPTRKECREALHRIKSQEQVHQARLAQS